MANLKLRLPVLCSLTALVTCAVVALVFLRQVQATYDQCTGTHNDPGQWCEGVTSCQTIDTCQPLPVVCPDGECGPMGQECSRQKFTDAKSVGTCYKPIYTKETCAWCDVWDCARGDAWSGLDSNGMCMNKKCPTLWVRTNVCIPPAPRTP
jgi:hypothetical protein